jgi:hypothetical protein
MRENPQFPGPFAHFMRTKTNRRTGWLTIQGSNSPIEIGPLKGRDYFASFPSTCQLQLFGTQLLLMSET